MLIFKHNFALCTQFFVSTIYFNEIEAEGNQTTVLDLNWTMSAVPQQHLKINMNIFLLIPVVLCGLSSLINHSGHLAHGLELLVVDFCGRKATDKVS